ncbi:TPA: hypothetical protein ACITN2_004676 [Salmonella enterica subsp. enterica serovar Virchow]
MFIPGYALIIIALALIVIALLSQNKAGRRIAQLTYERNEWRVKAEALPRARLTLGLQNARTEHARGLWADHLSAAANIEAAAKKISAYAEACPAAETLANHAVELTRAAHRLHAVNLDNVLTMMHNETAPYRKEWEEVQDAKAKANTLYHL